MSRITITIDVEGDNVSIAATPAGVSSAPVGDEPPFPTAAPAPTVAAPPQPPTIQSVNGPVPQCPTHGPMTFHPAGPNKAGTKQVSASYRCDVRTNDAFCTTKPHWL